VPGRAIRTANYRVFTILPRGSIADRMPAFLEASLARYRSAFVPLDGPEVAMESFLVTTRGQWQRLAKTLLGDDAGAFLHIQRGGVSIQGRGMFYDIGPRDTFVIAAHEGWHQFAQRTFREPLPTWADEGLATYMEGFRWSDTRPGEPEFNGWINLERFDALRSAHRSNLLLRLEQLVAVSPQDLAEAGPDTALVVYAQLWAMMHFLREGSQGEHAGALSRLVADSAEGRVAEHVERALGTSAADRVRGRRGGADVFKAYFGSPAAMEDEYRAAVERIVELGGRERVAAGRSALAPD